MKRGLISKLKAERILRRRLNNRKLNVPTVAILEGIDDYGTLSGITAIELEKAYNSLLMMYGHFKTFKYNGK